MIASQPPEYSAKQPALLPALFAMTALQALVSLAQFAPGVLAPKIGLGVREVTIFTTTFCAVGMTTSLYGGSMTQKFGSCRVAMFCALAVICGMTCATFDGTIALLLAGIFIGMAFGPETPASSALLSRLSNPGQRPLIFSIRQTGNQIGAMAGSISLPLFALWSPQLGFWLIAGLGVIATVVYASMHRRYDNPATASTHTIDLRAALQMIWQDRALRVLAILSLPFSSMQLGLNAFLVTFAVERLGFAHIAAGRLLAIAQFGGLVGRLFWGLVAVKSVPSRSLLAGLGLGMSAAALAIGLAGPHLDYTALAIIAFLFGMTASGWNGVFLAEITRLAPPDRVGEATGAVLTASYAGLLISPAIIASTAMMGTLSLSYAVLAGLTVFATLQLLTTPTAPKSQSAL